MLSFLSPIISGLALVWAIYSFFIKSRDEERDKERNSIKMAIESQEIYMRKELYDMKAKLAKQEDELVKMKLSLISLITQSKAHTASFSETVQRWEKTLDRHEQKLDNFGKVIIKDK